LDWGGEFEEEAGVVGVAAPPPVAAGPELGEISMGDWTVELKPY
jgi:hypothetical protein